MSGRVASLERFLFGASPAADLALSRIAFFGWLGLFYLPVYEGYASQAITAFADVAPVFQFTKAAWLFHVLGLPVLSRPELEVVQWAWRASLFTSCIGLFTRTSMTVAFVLGSYCLGLPFIFGKLSHTTGLLVIVLGLLALSRAGDRFSVDAWRKRTPTPPSWGEYRWPIRFVWISMAVVYLSSAACKLSISGLGYFHPGVMSGFLLHNQYAPNSAPLTDWGIPVAGSPALCSAISVAIVAIELGFPLALVSTRARAILVPAAFAGHVGIALLLGPRFFQLMACFCFWVPWSAWLGRWRVNAPSAGDPKPG